MSEAYFNWLAGHAGDDRNHFHEQALHEARIANEVRMAPTAAARTTGVLDRVRAALTGAAPADRCDCPAAA